MSLDVINCALAHLGEPPLRSDAKSIRFDQATRHVDKALERVLRDVNWSEETVTRCLGELDICSPCCDLPDGFCFAFALPHDFITAHDVTQRQNTTHCCHELCDLHWKVAKVHTKNGPVRALLTNLGPVQMEYICKPSDIDTLPIDTFDMVALELAIRMVPEVKADKSLKESLMVEYRQRKEESARTSGSQDAERLTIPNGFLTGNRLGDHDILSGERTRSRFYVDPDSEHRRPLSVDNSYCPDDSGNYLQRKAEYNAAKGD